MISATFAHNINVMKVKKMFIMETFTATYLVLVFILSHFENIEFGEL